ncbi:MAG TPA: NADAR family protein [Candidatus Saccharimonadales bacterium]|nr:NADAR family protein [Candidatus Saccharimonadales bacterium]
MLEQFRDPNLALTGDLIGFYEREFYPFSNFSSFSIRWRDRLWQTSEHAYQAAHFFETAPDLVELIFHSPSAHAAFKIAKAYVDRAPANWEEIKVGIMEDICRHKLQQHPYVERKLRQTLDLPLVEDSTKDACWGWGPNRDGRNELGKIWMKLRAELYAKDAEHPFFRPADQGSGEEG